MRLDKRIFLRVFLLLEVIVFLGFYVISPNGLPLLYSKQEDNQNIVHQITVLEKEVAALEKDIDAWNSDPFYKEKIAREQLHMMRPNDEVYVIV